MITVQEIAKEFGILPQSVYACLAPTSKARGPRAEQIRSYAYKCGWKPLAQREKESKPLHYWYDGCFLTKAEEIKRMEELRAVGYSNDEIAKKVGRSLSTIYNGIGAQPKEITDKNIKMRGKIRSQKNAERKQCVIDKSVNEYNKLVEEVRSVEAHLSKIKQDLAAKEQAVQKNARRTVKTPSISFATTEIAG